MERHPIKLLSLLSLTVLIACAGGSNDNGSSPQWIVMRADKAADEAFALYATPDDGSMAPRLLSPAGSVAFSFSVSPDGRWAAFTARKDTNGDNVVDSNDGPPELYWAPVDGSAAALDISGPLPAYSSILAFTWSPNSDMLAFRADIDTDDIDEIYLATLQNPSPVKINGSVGSTVEMGAFLWSPDGRYLAQVVRNRDNRFIGDRVAINVYDTTLGMPNSTRLTGPTLPGSCFPVFVGCPAGAPTGANIGGTIVWAPDSSRLAYLVEDQDAGTRIHYQALPSGSFERVTGPLAAGEDGGLDLAWSPDSRYLAYSVTTNASTNIVEAFDTTNKGIQRAFVAPNGGRIFRTLNWQPAGGRFALAASRSSGGPNELFFVSPTDDGAVAPTPISAPLPADSTVFEHNWSPNGTRAGYRVLDTAAGTSQLYSVAADGSGAPIRFSHDSPGTSASIIFDWLPDSARVLYGLGDGFFVAPADQANAAVSVSGTLNPEVNFNGSPRQSASASDRTSGAGRIAMLAERDGDGVSRLYTVRPDGSGLTDVSGDLVAGGHVTAFAFAAVLN